LGLVSDLRTRLRDRLGDLLDLLDDLLDARNLGLLELLGALLERLLGAQADRLCHVGLPQEECLLKVDDLGDVRQLPGGEPVAGLHRLSVRPLGVRFELFELVDRLRDLLRDGLVERLGLLLVLLAGLLLRRLAFGLLLRRLSHVLLR